MGRPFIDTWAILYDRCTECNRTSVPHKAKGLCEVCYDREKKRKHAARKRGEKGVR